MGNKKPLVRVTEVLGYVESAWKEWWWRKVGFEAADKVSRESAAFGTLVHKKIEKDLKNQAKVPVDSQLPEDQCASVILRWLNENKIRPLFDSYFNSLEIEVKDKQQGLIGHFDYAGVYKDQAYIIDFKTSNKIRKSFPLQKAAYAKMATKQFGIQIDNGLTIRAHWDKEKQCVDFETKEYKNLAKKYWPLFKSCLNVFKYFK